MNRNPEQRMREDRYSYENPPPSEEDARVRMDVLIKDIVSIETGLESRTPDRFASQEEYDAWRGRAAGALRWTKTELKYLERYLEEYNEKRLKVEKPAVEQKIILRVNELVAAIGEQYTRVYWINNKPESPAVAEERYALVCAIKDRIAQEFVDIRSMANPVGIGKKQLTHLWAPLSRLGAEVNSEATFLYRFIHPQGVRRPEAHSDTLRSVEELAFALAEPIEREWSLLGGAMKKPLEKVSQAKERLTVLGSLTTQVTRALGEVNKACEGRNFGEENRRNLKRPLTELHDAFVAETVSVRAYIREHSRSVRHGQLDKTQQDGSEQKDAADDSVDQLTEIANGIKARAREMAQALEREYKPLFNDERLPASRSEAEERRQHIARFRVKLQECLAVVTDEWTSHPLRRSDLPSVKRPLTTLLENLKAETNMIKAYLAENAQEIKNQSARWKTVCVLALMRAQAEGFKLTSEEQEVLKYLLANIAESSDRQ